MDYNFNDVESMLRNGYDEEVIAKAFADSLNKAIKVVGEEEQYSGLADAWNNAVAYYCKVNKIHNKEDYFITWKNARDIVAASMRLGRVINDNEDTMRKFFKQLGI